MTERQKIQAKYGTWGAAYQAKHCILWEVQKEFEWFPAKKIFINRDFAAKLRIAFTNLEINGRYKEVKTFDGCLMERKSRGLGDDSLHSWAMAIDLNAKDNPLGGRISFSPNFLKAFRDAGLYCGADWKRTDAMHFALYNG